MIQRVSIQSANEHGISMFNGVRALNTESNVLKEKTD
jgi:hypothetical protein